MGGYYMVADVGSKDKLEPLNIRDKRVPHRLVSSLGKTSRPDILIVHMPLYQCTSTSAQAPPRGTKITIVEVTFTSDYGIDKKVAEHKLQQHLALKTALEAQGYEVEYQVWDIGHTGMIPQKLATYAASLGIDNSTNLLTNLHTIAVEHALKIVHARRSLERSGYMNDTRPAATTDPANNRPP
jgi:hypothetical protein